MVRLGAFCDFIILLSTKKSFLPSNNLNNIAQQQTETFSLNFDGIHWKKYIEIPSFSSHYILKKTFSNF